MNNMRTLTFAAVAVAAAGEAVPYGAPLDQAWAPAKAARDDCAALSALCTGPAMISGTATTLTYVCPKTTAIEAATTVVVTVTTTVTESPTSSAPVQDPVQVVGASTSSALIPSLVPAPTIPGGPDDPVSTSEEATTTTTVHSTTKLTKTIIVSHKKSLSSFIPAIPTTIDPATTAPPFSTLSKNVTISVSTIPVPTANSSSLISMSTTTLPMWRTPSELSSAHPVTTHSELNSVLPIMSIVNSSAPALPSSRMIEISAVVTISDVSTLTTIDAASLTTSPEISTAIAKSLNPIFQNSTSTTGYAIPSVLRIRNDASSMAATPLSAAASSSVVASASSAASFSSSDASSSSAASSASEASSSIAASSISTAATPSKTGGTMLQSVSFAMLVFGLIMAAYLA